jgi:heptaprenyl diphosphate synthase
MKKSLDIKKLTVISVLIAFSVVLSYFDRIISDGILTIVPVLGFMFQGFRIGLANIVILIMILNFSFKDSLVGAILKSVLVGFLFGALPTFVIGFTGTMFSYFAMQFACRLKKNKTKRFLIFISILGGVSHGLGQMAAFVAFYPQIGLAAPLIEIPGTIIVGILSGAFVGVIVNSANYHLKNSYLVKYEKKSV